jgi:hypothetical protein
MSDSLALAQRIIDHALPTLVDRAGELRREIPVDVRMSVVRNMVLLDIARSLRALSGRDRP